jgi:hypothetical protein
LGDGDASDDGQSEAVMLVDVRAVESLEDEEEVDRASRVTGLVFALEMMALSRSTRVEVPIRPPGTL